MMLWLAFAVLAAAATAAVLWPLGRRPRASPPGAAGDLAVYQDQIAEIARDAERGLISPEDAKAARAEVARRVLRAAAEPGAETAERSAASAAGRERRRNALTIAAALAVPVLALALYVPLGAPGLPGQPHARAPSAPDQAASIAILVARVEARLREHPDDGQGWDVIAPVYLRLGRHEDAIDAYRRALRINGESETRLMGLVEAMVAIRDGIVSEDARAVLEKVLRLNAGSVAARYLIALAKEQDGKLAEAAADYKALLAAAPADAPWRASLEQRLAAVEPGRKGPVERAPDAEQIEAARSLTPEQRAAMINSMVEGLAQRLAKDGRDLAGWLRLARAYAVLGKHTEARAALAGARRNFPADAAAAAEIAATEKALGL